MKKQGDIRIRLSKNQKDQLINLVEASPYKTTSDFVRAKIFDADLSIHAKLNKILCILQEGKNDK